MGPKMDIIGRLYVCMYLRGMHTHAPTPPAARARAGVLRERQQEGEEQG